MGKVLLHARITPTTGGSEDTRILACTDLGALYVRTDTTLPGSSASLSSNIAYLDGNAIDLGAGAVGTGTIRSTLASNDPAVVALQIIDDWDESDRAKVNLIVGQAGIAAGAGAVGATVPRVTQASDCPSVTALQIIDNCIGTDGAAVPSGVAVVAGTDSATGYAQTLSTDSAGVLYNQPSVVPSFEDSVNGRAEVFGVGSDTYEPTPPAAVTVNASETTLQIGGANWVKTLGYDYCEVWVKNAGGAGGAAFTDVNVYTSPDGTDANSQDVSAWADTVEQVCRTATTGQARVAMVFDKAPAWIKVTAVAAASPNDTTGYAFLVCRKGS